jgi:ferredoxin
MSNGKKKCELLKSLRKQIAEEYSLAYNPVECTHEGDCLGSCPQCDVEIEDLQRQLDALGVDNIRLNEEILAKMDDITPASDEDEELLMGMPDLTILPGIPYPPGDSQQYRILLMDCRVAGTQYQSLDNVKKLLYHRAPLKLVREEHNKYDEYAVAVHFEDDDNNCSYKIGYVPRSLSRVIAVIMDAGWSDIFEAEIDGFKMHADKNESIHMSIYVLGTREKR